MAGKVKEVTIKINVDTGEVIEGKEDFDALNKSVTKGSKEMEGSVGMLTSSLKKMAAQMAGAFAVKEIVVNAVKTIATFEKSIADLGAITGATGKDLEAFQKQVIAVSKATGKGASEIAKAFQIVGSAQPELLKSAAALGEVTKQAVLLAQAGGLEVPEAAKALTLAMNQFGASAAEAAKFTDILATSQQKGTATIVQLAESLKNVGAVAKGAGITFEETNVALQAMAKGGLIGAEAGTGLRAVILRLQAAGVGFVDGQFNLQAAIEETKNRFELIQDPVKRVQEGVKLFGQENIKTGNTLMDQISVLKDLNGELNETGAAMEQAAVKMDTITGRNEKLQSSWERTLVTFDDGEGVIGGTIKALQDLAAEVLDLVDAGEKLDKLGLTREEQFGSEFSMTLTTSAKALLEFNNQLDEQITNFKLSNPSAEEYSTKMKGIHARMETLNRDIPEQNAQYLILRNTLISLGNEYKKLGDKQKKVDGGDEGGATGSEQRKKDLETIKKHSKARISEMKMAAKDEQEAMKLDQEDDDEFLNSIGLSDEQIDLKKKQREEDAQAEIDAEILKQEGLAEAYDKGLEVQKQYTEARKSMNLELAASGAALASALANALGGSAELQTAALVFQKAVEIARIITKVQADNAIIFSQGAAFSIPTGGASATAAAGLIAANNINAALQVATVAATAIPQFKQINQPKKLKDGEIMIQGPGTETSDSIPTLLSKNESVIKASSSKKHRVALKAINDDRFDSYLNSVIAQKLIYRESKQKNIVSLDKNIDVKIPDMMSIKNARAISKPIVDAIEEQNFLKGAGWQ